MKTTSANYLPELVAHNRRMYALLHNGVPILQCLDILSGEASPEYGEAWQAIRERVLNRGRITDEMPRFPHLFPAFYQRLVAEGEETGNLDGIAGEVAELLAPVTASGRVQPGDNLDWLSMPIDLIRFTRQYAVLLGRGIEWHRSLYILERELRPPFNVLIKDFYILHDEKTGTWKVIWQHMVEHPEIFSPFYTAMVRVGWEGRILDEIMKYLGELLTEDWTLSQFAGWSDGRPSLLIPTSMAPVTDFASLNDRQQKLAILLFCRTLCMLMSIGTPEQRALEVAAQAMPETECKVLTEIAQSDETEKPIFEVAKKIFSDFSVALIRAGVVSNRIERTLNAIADCYHEEIAGRG